MRQIMLMPNWDFRARAQFLQDVFRKMTCIMEVPGSITNPKTGYFAEVFVAYLSVLQKPLDSMLKYVKIKVKSPHTTPLKTQRVKSGTAWYILNSMTVSGQRHAKAALPAGKNPEPIILV